MRNLLLLIAFVMISTAGYSQSVPLKSNAIVITLSDSNTVSEKISKVLEGKDYTVNTGKNNTLITAPKTLKNGARVSYSFQSKGADVILTGKIVVAGQSNMIIEYTDKKGTPIMNGWEEMDKIAKALGGKIKYEKQ